MSRVPGVPSGVTTQAPVSPPPVEPNAPGEAEFGPGISPQHEVISSPLTGAPPNPLSLFSS